MDLSFEDCVTIRKSCECNHDALGSVARRLPDSVSPLDLRRCAKVMSQEVKQLLLTLLLGFASFFQDTGEAKVLSRHVCIATVCPRVNIYDRAGARLDITPLHTDQKVENHIYFLRSVFSLTRTSTLAHNSSLALLASSLEVSHLNTTKKLTKTSVQIRSAETSRDAVVQWPNPAVCSES